MWNYLIKSPENKKIFAFIIITLDMNIKGDVNSVTKLLLIILRNNRWKSRGWISDYLDGRSRFNILVSKLVFSADTV